jgi:EXLDI family protein
MPDMPYTTEFPTGSEASHMPNKTIYVADSDLPIFERAQELAGENLSATIAGALRRYVKAEEARARGFDEISLKVGSHRNYTVKRFMGRELARRRERDEAMRRVVTETVFQTAKGRFAVYTRSAPDWSGMSSWLSDWLTDWGGDWDVDVDVDVNAPWGSRWRVRKGGVSASGSAGSGRPGRPDRPDPSAWTSEDERTLEVYDTLDDLKAHIGPELVDAVTRALRGEEDEFLDI